MPRLVLLRKSECLGAHLVPRSQRSVTHPGRCPHRCCWTEVLLTLWQVLKYSEFHTLWVDALAAELLDKRQGDQDDDTATPVKTRFTVQKRVVNTVHMCAQDQDDCNRIFWQAYHSVKTFNFSLSGILNMCDLSDWRKRKETSSSLSPHLSVWIKPQTRDLASD